MSKEAEAAKSAGVYYDEHMLNASELKILVDAVQSSEFITEMKSKELIQKQEKLTILYRLVWVRTLLKDRLVI